MSDMSGAASKWQAAFKRATAKKDASNDGDNVPVVATTSTATATDTNEATQPTASATEKSTATKATEAMSSTASKWQAAFKKATAKSVTTATNGASDSSAEQDDDCKRIPNHKATSATAATTDSSKDAPKFTSAKATEAISNTASKWQAALKRAAAKAKSTTTNPMPGTASTNANANANNRSTNNNSIDNVDSMDNTGAADKPSTSTSPTKSTATKASEAMSLTATKWQTAFKKAAARATSTTSNASKEDNITDATDSPTNDASSTEANATNGSTVPKASGAKRLSSMFMKKRMSVTHRNRKASTAGPTGQPNTRRGTTNRNAILEKLTVARQDFAASTKKSSDAAPDRRKVVKNSSFDPSPGFAKTHGAWETSSNSESDSKPAQSDGLNPQKKVSDSTKKSKQALVVKKKESKKDQPPSKEGAMWNKMLRTSLRLVTAKRRVMAKRVKLHNVWANSLDEESSSSFTPPVHPKTAQDRKLITDSMTQNFVFDNLMPQEMEPMINAFETIEYQANATIVEQGEQGWFFYIVKTGSVSFYVDGKCVGSATAGYSFGELALLYCCPRAASVKADGVIVRNDEGNTEAVPPTVLFRVYQMSFRHLLRAQLKKSTADRMNLLRSVDFFKNLEEADLKQLASAMLPHVFKKGEAISSATTAVPFCLVQEGEVIATDVKIGEKAVEDVYIGPGQHFGEDSLSKLGASVATVTALSHGVAFTIDRDTFEKVFGDLNRLAIKTLHKQRLEAVPMIKDANLTDAELDTLARQVEDKTFGARRVIFTRGSMCTPALYMVEKGSVKLIKKDGVEEIVQAGGYFGGEFFEAPPSSSPTTKVSTTMKAKCTALTLEQTICGILTLRECRIVFGPSIPGASKRGSDVSEGGILRSGSHRMLMDDEPEIEPMEFDDLTQHRIVGTGLFGKVWLVSNKKTNNKDLYALKIQSTKKKVRPNAVKLIKGEIKIMKRLQHPFVVNLICTFQDEDTISMLMGLAPGGELFDIIHQEDENGNWASGIGEIGKFYAMVVADTLAFMHRRNYVYRDLKPENVLIDIDGYPVITDFGFTKKVTDKLYTFCGTPNYLPPEIIRNRGHDVTADNWCLGVLIYELIEGENPFFETGMDQMTLYETICKEPHYPLPEDSVSWEARDLVDRLLEKDPNKRLGTFREKDILAHPWFSEYDLKKLRNKEIESPWIPDAIEA